MTEKELDILRLDMEKNMSPKRFRHTYEVERMALRLGSIFFPNDKEALMKLRAAALLHDMTKEYTAEMQLYIMEKKGIALTREDRAAPKTFHARTAAALIPDEYPELADPDVVTAVRYHTTGRPDMTLYEKLIYLADYIDMSRTFADCVTLREYFFGKDVEEMTESEKLRHLDDTLILSFDMTIKGLIEEGRVVSADTIAARNHLICSR